MGALYCSFFIVFIEKKISSIPLGSNCHSLTLKGQLWQLHGKQQLHQYQENNLEKNKK